MEETGASLRTFRRAMLFHDSTWLLEVIPKVMSNPRGIALKNEKICLFLCTSMAALGLHLHNTIIASSYSTGVVAEAAALIR
jgi:hypothetical protein